MRSQLLRIYRQVSNLSNKNLFQRTFSSDIKSILKEEPKIVESVNQKVVSEIPLHLQPYNKEKYEVPITQIKVYIFKKAFTGYSLLDVDPMPKATIMKLCYNILYKVKKMPETSICRIYIEEKMKYLMKLTDEAENIRDLERQVGFEAIEMFINGLKDEMSLVDDLLGKFRIIRT